MKRIILIAVALIIGGCGTPLLTSEQLAAADFGSYPDNYVSIVKQYFEMRLKDPSSVMYRDMTSPKKIYFKPVSVWDDPKLGYIVCVSMNAKNSLGGYVGFTNEALLIRNGEVIELAENDSLELVRSC